MSKKEIKELGKMKTGYNAIRFLCGKNKARIILGSWIAGYKYAKLHEKKSLKSKLLKFFKKFKR